jgi:ribokinase
MTMNNHEIAAQVAQVRLLVAGSINHDLFINVDSIPSDDGAAEIRSFSRGFGGHGANCAVAVARLGANACLLGVVGDDHHGRELCKDMEINLVNTSGIHIDPRQPTGSVLIPSSPTARYMLMHRGANDAEFDWQTTLSERDPAEFNAVVVMDPGQNLVDAILAWLAGRSSPRLVWAPGGLFACFERFSSISRMANTIILNRREYEATFGKPLAPSANQASGFDGDLVVTLGSRGAMLIGASGTRTFCPAFEVDAIDETGAGDAFIAAYAVALAIDQFSNLDRLRIANMLGGLTTTGIGARTGHHSFASLVTSDLRPKELADLE